MRTIAFGITLSLNLAEGFSLNWNTICQSIVVFTQTLLHWIQTKSFYSRDSQFTFVFFLKQNTRPAVLSCHDLDEIFDKTVCGVSLPVFHSRSAVSHTAPRHLHNRHKWSFINQELWPTASTFDIYNHGNFSHLDI